MNCLPTASHIKAGLKMPDIGRDMIFFTKAPCSSWKGWAAIRFFAGIFWVGLTPPAMAQECPACSPAIVLTKQGRACLFDQINGLIEKANASGIEVVNLRPCQTVEPRKTRNERTDNCDRTTDPVLCPPTGNGGGVSPEDRGEAPSFFLLTLDQLLCLKRKEDALRGARDDPITFDFRNCEQPD